MRQVTLHSVVTHRPYDRRYNATMSEHDAHAYDPIRDEDVPIRCSNKHQDTDYDAIDGEKLPVLIDSDFRHDPVEACQGSFTQIAEIEGGCPNCGYDRMNVSVHTLAGEHRESCRACGVDITDRGRDDWEPKKPYDPVEATRRNSEYLRQLGTDTKLYRRNERLYALLKHGNIHTMSEDETVDLALAVIEQMDEGDLARHNGHRLINAVCGAIETPEDDDD